MPKLLIKGANGIEMHIECDEATKQCLISGDTDPQLKDMIVKMLIAQQCPEPTVSTPSATSSVNNSNPKTQATPHDEISAASVHVWKDKQEDMLVHLRHERQDLFEKKPRNHGTLWNLIAKDLSNIFHMKITPTQALNKYNNLKKRWKEIIDSGTGTERKYFRLKEEFDLMYGAKQSSKPSFIMNSITGSTCNSSESNECPFSDKTKTTSTNSKSPKKKEQKCAKKRKQAQEILDHLDAKKKNSVRKLKRCKEWTGFLIYLRSVLIKMEINLLNICRLGYFKVLYTYSVLI
ncbi:uncharacterized protein LOC125646359 [Ostrea edulis]|uniref:uncharacterized protein LOC125646359 n=1 Tax=Ostrea edulis TaxID=37623 RepID=UPI0024AF07B2|nr:uncharacterized protein LOC125646359 [Ostrea edulis]